MGTPVKPVILGSDCPQCWSPGKSPENVWVYFAGIERCPLAIKSPPNGQTFKLTQDPDNPCFYEHTGSEWHVWWRAFDPIFMESMLYLEEVGGLGIFVSRTINCPPECFVYHSTIEVCQWPVAGRFGVGVVHWMGIVLHLIVAFNLPSSSYIMHELFVTDEDRIVYKFCFPKYSMNVKFLL